jgi:aryl-alcohol dehydrogenase-like predicted oxidoreductase
LAQVLPAILRVIWGRFEQNQGFAVIAIRRAIAGGINWIDTAAQYVLI